MAHDPHPRSAPKLTVVVIAYEDAGIIERAVAAVVAQASDGEVEVIVVTSGTDATADIVRRRFPEVTVIDLGRRALPGAARNAGLAVARGDYVSFPGSHVQLAPGSLAARIRAHDAGHVMVAGTMLCGTRTQAGWAAYFLDHARALPGRPSGVLGFSPGSCSYRRAELQEIGGFPDVRVGEDTEVNDRLFADGHRAFRAADVRLFHHSPCATLPKLLRHHFQRGRGFGRILTADPARARERLAPLGFRGYVLRRLRTTTRNVWRWGRPLRGRYVVCLPYVALGTLAAWCGIWWQAGLAARARRRQPS